MLTQAQVKNLFNYHEGKLFWRVRLNARASIGSEAGCQTYLSGLPYRTIGINNKKYLTHRIVFLMFKGYLPTKLDHFDRNTLNNCSENLRETTASQNGYNTKISTINTSGVKGVNWHKIAKKWRVEIRVNGEKKYLGLFSNIDVAKHTIQQARINYHGEFACNN